MPPRTRKAAAKKTAAPKLRSVPTGDAAPPPPPEPPKPKTLAEAIESGTYLEVLEAQRRELVKDLPNTAGPAKAAMHRQLALLSKDIEALRAIAKQEAAEDASDEGATPNEEWDPAAL